MDPSYIQAHIGLGLAYQQTRRLSESVEVFRNARLLYDTPPMLALLGTTYALSARTADAREVVKQLTQLATHRYVSPYVIAPIYACLGESDTAFQCLEKAYRERSGGILWLKIDPTLQSLHSDPRFINMVRRIGIPQ